MQLRPNMAYLDKEKEAAAAAGKKGQEAMAEEEKAAPELMAVTVQVRWRWLGGRLLLGHVLSFSEMCL